MQKLQNLVWGALFARWVFLRGSVQNEYLSKL